MDVNKEIADMRGDIGTIKGEIGMIKNKLDNAIILTISPKVMAGLIGIGGVTIYIGGV